ncbi:MAG TPA: Ig-like domain-containing protein [Vicinamibacterales bacterium]|nr:Ig-like domain-containing protein [Vicinamibacterales bacterium]
MRCSFVVTASCVLVGVVVAVAQSVPPPWTTAAVGAPALSGSASFNGTAFAVAGSGKDVWDTSDQFQFVFQQITGDSEIVARLDSLAGSNAWAKAGVMIRATLAANSAHAFALVSRSNGVRFQRRRQTSGSSTSTTGPSVSAPRWVRLTRIGSKVAAYSSADGVSWALMASDTIALGATAYVGLAVTSHDTSSLAQASFSHVSAASLALPSPQQQTDIGSPAIAGGAQYRQGSYTISGAGSDIWGASDQFHYVFQQVSGDLDVVARVASIAQTSAWAKAGVMVRESLAPDARHATAFASAADGYAFQRRIDPGGASENTAGGVSAPPGWVRLVRTGYQFQAFWSLDGVTWQPMGTDTVPMTDPVYVGIAVTSHNASQATTAVVDSLTIGAGSGTTNQPPAVSITAPANGATFTAPATVSVTASASDPENRLARVDLYQGSTLLASDPSAPFSFVWQSVPAGTYQLTAVAYDADGGSTTSAAVGISVNAAANQPPTVSLTSPANGATFGIPAIVALLASASDPENRMARVDFYAGATLIGSSNAAPYGVTWSGAIAGSYALKAIAYDQDGGVTTSAVVGVTLTAYAGPKTVSFTASTDNAIVTSYVLDVFANGADPNTATPVASSNLGKPTPDSSNTITVDQTAFFEALAPGAYVATVSAVDSCCRGRGAPVTFVR